MIKIKFYSLIRMHLGINEVELDTKQTSIFKLMQKAEKKINSEFINLLIDDDKQVIHGTMILINGRNIVHLDGLNSIVIEGDEINIFPPGGGG